jgi:hypothetical protein
MDLLFHVFAAEGFTAEVLYTGFSEKRKGAVCHRACG